MADIILDALIDSVKLLPFLFVTYLLMEYIEHKTSNKTKETIKKSGRFGPIIGGILGAVPQCGFSVSATNLYVGRIITLGTLISIYLSTSDEMLPILISNNIGINVILKILSIKILIGILAGTIIDLIIRKTNKNKEQEQNPIEEICKHEHCHCEEGILKSALKHTISIFGFIIIITLILNTLIYFIGEDALSGLMANNTILAPIIVCLIGLIPNCAASVVITELYVTNIIGIGTLIGGLLVNSGLGLVILLKVNKNMKENISIILTLYIIGVISAILI